MLILVVLLLARLLSRCTWAAVVAAMLLGTVLSLLGSVAEPMPVVLRVFSSLSFALIAGTMFACMLRFGLLSVIGGVFILNALYQAQLTWDLSKWYAGAALVSRDRGSGVTVWAFRNSLAGQPLFRDSV